MEIRVLNYFLMVAREENITKAANLLHITQPTLSRQLMQLEEELGVKLFVRNSHNISLTEDGLLLKRRAQEMITLAEKTKQELMREEEITGEIAIGSGELQGMGILLCLKLDVNTEGVTFIPLSPALEMGTVLVWKKNQTFSPALEAFTKFCRECLKSMT